MIHLTSNPKKVLIVARPTQALHTLVNHLRDMSCVVEVAATPEKALQSATVLMPEIVILDDHLPGYDSRRTHAAPALPAGKRPAPGVPPDAAHG